MARMYNFERWFYICDPYVERGRWRCPSSTMLINLLSLLVTSSVAIYDRSLRSRRVSLSAIILGNRSQPFLSYHIASLSTATQLPGKQSAWFYYTSAGRNQGRAIRLRYSLCPMSITDMEHMLKITVRTYTSWRNLTLRFSSDLVSFPG